MAKKVADITTPGGLTPLPTTPQVSLSRAGAPGRALAQFGETLQTAVASIVRNQDEQALRDLQTENITFFSDLRDNALANPDLALKMLIEGREARIEAINNNQAISARVRALGLSDAARRAASVSGPIRAAALQEIRAENAASVLAKREALRQEAVKPGTTPERAEALLAEAIADTEAAIKSETIGDVEGQIAIQNLPAVFRFGNVEAAVRAEIEVAKATPTPAEAEVLFASAKLRVGATDMSSDQQDQLLGEIEIGESHDRQTRTREKAEREETAGREILSRYIKGITPVAEGEEQTPLLTPADIDATPDLSTAAVGMMLRLVSSPAAIITDERYFQLLRQAVRRNEFERIEDVLALADPTRLSKAALGTLFNEYFQSRDRTKTAFLSVQAEHFDLAHALFTKTPVDMFGSILDGVSPDRSAIISLLTKNITTPSLEATLASYVFRETVAVELARLEEADKDTSAFFRPSTQGGFWDMLQDALANAGKATAPEEAGGPVGVEPQAEVRPMRSEFEAANITKLTPEKLKNIRDTELTPEELTAVQAEVRRRIEELEQAE